MTRRIKRQRDFEITLNITNDNFIRPPRDAQRNWLLNKSLAEFVDDLNALHPIAASFVPGIDQFNLENRTHKVLTDDEIMEDWQIPIMQAMAKVAAAPDRDLLEVGFGRGVSADMIQSIGAKSHTIIECNDSVVERYLQWCEQYPQRDIRLLHGRWQDVTDQLEQYDSIFFHTYALDEEEYLETAVKSSTFAEHFFPTASKHLREGGVFTYLTNEIDSLSRAHQRAVFKYFSSFTLHQVTNLDLPQDIHDTWWANSMIVIKAVK